MGIIAWIVLGLISGLVAEYLTGRKTGLLVAAVIGVLGALAGGFLAKVIFGVDGIKDFFSISTWITAIIGSLLLFLVYGMLRGRTRR
jgi:uncharacterized membrane protein YeaQ/YmgE (transglycosylase-associated protein family)